MPAPLLIICVLVDTSSTVLWAPTPSSVKPAWNAFFQSCWGIKGHVFRKHSTGPGQGGLSFLKQCLGLGPPDPGDQARSHWAAVSPPLCPHSTLGHRRIFLKHSVTPSLHSIWPPLPTDRRWCPSQPTLLPSWPSPQPGPPCRWIPHMHPLPVSRMCSTPPPASVISQMFFPDLEWPFL